MKADFPSTRGVAALALLAAASTLAACDRHETVASKSARAFAAAQERGESFAGQGHGHEGHGTEAAPEPPTATPDGSERGNGRAAEGDGQAASRDVGHRHGATTSHARHAARAQPPESALPSSPPASSRPGAAPGGHDMSTMAHDNHPQPPTPPPPPARSAAPGAPAAVLAPDSIDAPAVKSVVEAQRAVGSEVETGDAHGTHGGTGYRQGDAGARPRATPPPPHADATPHRHRGGEGTR